jgi:ATP-dependent Clp protease protease subunit
MPINRKKNTKPAEVAPVPPAQPVKDEEEGETQIIPFDLLQAMMSNGKQDDSLEARGIIFLDKEINSMTVGHIIKRIMSLHFNPDFKDSIQLILNSPGGSTDAGWALIDVMAWVKNPVRTIALGEICSMATSIFISGDERVMGSNALAMIHQFSWGRAGNYSELVASRKAEDLQDKMDIKHLIKHSKYKTEADVRKHLLQDTDNWLSPEEMKKHGLCDRVLSATTRRKK